MSADYLEGHAFSGQQLIFYFFYLFINDDKMFKT